MVRYEENSTLKKIWGDRCEDKNARLARCSLVQGYGLFSPHSGPLHPSSPPAIMVVRSGQCWPGLCGRCWERRTEGRWDIVGDVWGHLWWQGLGQNWCTRADIPRAQQKHFFSKIRLSSWTQVPKFSIPGGDTIDLVGNNVTGIDRSSNLKNRKTTAVCLLEKHWSEEGFLNTKFFPWRNTEGSEQKC